MSGRIHAGRLVFGLTLLAAGVLWLLDALDIADTGHFLGDWWPMAIIAFGLAGLISRQGSRLGAGIVLVVGVLLQLGQLEIGDISWGAAIAPAMLVLVGLALLLRPRDAVGPFGSASETVTGDKLHAVALFSGSEPRVHSGQWQGGDATAIFGGLDIDLRDVVPIEGARLQATALFGGVEVKVPQGWNVVVNGTGILGGVDDERRDRTPADGAPVLTVDATAIFGGVSVKD